MKRSMKTWYVVGGIFILLVIAYFAVGYLVYDMFTVSHPRCESVYMDGRREFTPANFEGVYDYPEIDLDVSPYLMAEYRDVEFPARGDGVRVSGWFVPASSPSDKVVIVVHGGDVCKRNTSVLLPAGMLANNGFNVLLIDLRNHGASEIVGQRFTAGLHEYKDVLGAYDWLRNEGYSPDKIGLMGVSMGAATSLIAFGEEPLIAAIWADSAFTNIPTMLEDQLEMNGLPAFLKNGVLIVAKIDGYDLNAISPLSSIANHQQRPLMIVHGLEDEWVNADSAPVLHQAAGPHAELWLIDNMRHVEAMFVYPQQYADQMGVFFEAALGE